MVRNELIQTLHQLFTNNTGSLAEESWADLLLQMNSDIIGGANARTLLVNAGTLVFSYNEAGSTPYPTSTIVDATILNSEGIVNYEFIVDETTVLNSTASSYEYIPPIGYNSLPQLLTVKAREGSTTGLPVATTQIAFQGTKALSGGITISLTQFACTLPTTTPGGIVTYTNSGTEIQVWEGDVPLTIENGTPPCNPRTFRIGTPITTDITCGTITQELGSSTAVVSDASDMIESVAVANIKFPIIVTNSAGQELNFTRMQLFTKGIQGSQGSQGSPGETGANGVSPIVVHQTNESHIFPSDMSGNVLDYSNSGTKFLVYAGTDHLNYTGDYVRFGDSIFFNTSLVFGAKSLSIEQGNFLVGSYTCGLPVVNPPDALQVGPLKVGDIWTSFTPVCTEGVEEISSGTFAKTSGTYAFNAQVYSVEGYTRCCVKFKPLNTHITGEYILIGLNSDPSIDGNYTGIDYCWDLLQDNTLAIYESNVEYTGFGSFTPSTELMIVADGTNVTYYKDGVVCRTTPYSGDPILYLDSSFRAVKSTIGVKDVQFGLYDLEIGEHSDFSGSVNIATVTYPLSIKHINGVIVDYLVAQKFTKAKQGYASQYIAVTGEQTFKYTSSSAPSPINVSIVLTATLYGGLTTYQWQYYDSTWQNLSGASTQQTYTLTYNQSEWGVKTNLRVRCLSDEYADEITIIKLYDGTDTISIAFPNESVLLPASSSGVVSSYDNSGGTIRVYQGITELDYDGAGTATGKWKIASSSVSPVNSLTVGSFTDSGNYLTVGNHSEGSSWSTDNATITYVISGKDLNGASFNLSKNQFIAKAKAGVDGLDGADGVDGSAGVSARSVTLSPGSNQNLAFTYNTSGSSPTPSSITLTAIALNTSGDVYYQFFKNDISQGTPSTTNTYPYSPPSSFTSMPEKVEVQIRENGIDNPILARDQAMLVGLKSGQSAITISMSNEAHTIPTDSGGSNGNYTGSGTTIQVWEGATQLIIDNTSTYASSTFRVSAGTGVGITKSASITQTDGQYIYTIGNHSNITLDTASIPYTITVKNSAGTETTYTLTQTFSRSKAGVDSTSYWIETSNGAISKANDNTFMPTSVIFYSKSKTGSGEVNDYPGGVSNYLGYWSWCVSTDGMTESTYTNESQNTSISITGWNVNSKWIRVKLFSDSNRTIQLDQYTIPVMLDGFSSYSLFIRGQTIINKSETSTKNFANLWGDLYYGTILKTGITYKWFKYPYAASDQLDTNHADVTGGKIKFVSAANINNGDFTIFTSSPPADGSWADVKGIQIREDAITSIQLYKLSASVDNINSISETIFEVVDKSDPYTVTLVCANGLVFQNGAGSDKQLEPKVFSGDIPVVLDTSYTFDYELVDRFGNRSGFINTTKTPTAKTITSHTTGTSAVFTLSGIFVTPPVTGDAVRLINSSGSVVRSYEVASVTNTTNATITIRSSTNFSSISVTTNEFSGGKLSVYIGNGVNAGKKMAQAYNVKCGVTSDDIDGQGSIIVSVNRV